MPQMASREGYMVLFTYRKEVAIVVLDHELGHRMIDVCLAANAAVGTWDTVKGNGFGDLTYEMFLHLGSMTIENLVHGYTYMVVQTRAVHLPQLPFPAEPLLNYFSQIYSAWTIDRKCSAWSDPLLHNCSAWSIEINF